MTRNLSDQLGGRPAEDYIAAYQLCRYKPCSTQNVSGNKRQTRAVQFTRSVDFAYMVRTALRMLSIWMKLRASNCLRFARSLAATRLRSHRRELSSLRCRQGSTPSATPAFGEASCRTFCHTPVSLHITAFLSHNDGLGKRVKPDFINCLDEQKERARAELLLAQLDESVEELGKVAVGAARKAATSEHDAQDAADLAGVMQFVCSCRCDTYTHKSQTPREQAEKKGGRT
eukprot:COSAG05_NODE_1468_length_4793_cov_6.365069_3_plen_230_part_00